VYLGVFTCTDHEMKKTSYTRLANFNSLAWSNLGTVNIYTCVENDWTSHYPL